MRKHYKLTGLIAVTGALALAVAGCSAGGGNGDGGEDGEAAETKTADNNPQPREKLKQGGEVTFPITEINEQMNANQTDGSVYSQMIWSWYNPQPILMSPEGEAEANPAYLSDWKTEEVDGKTVVTYTINPEAVWNDGTPITWQTFEQTWIANRSPDEGYQPNSYDGYSLIESVAPGVDDRQAVVTFSQVYPWSDGLFWTLTNPNVNTPDLFNTAYIGEPHPEWGAGPYKLDDFDANGGTISFVPNENWWGDEPMLDKVTFRQLDDVAMVNAFEAGEIDYADNLTADNLSRVEKMDDAVVYRAQRAANNLFEINSERPQFADLDVREAIMKAVDPEQITKVMWDGLGYTEDPAGSFMLYSFQDGYVNALEEAGWKYDTDEANKILDDAGWKKGKDDVREKDGQKLEGVLPLFGDDAIIEARGRVVQAQLKEIGVKVELDTRPSQDFSADYNSKNFDLVMLGFSSSDPYGLAYMCQTYCSDSTLNYSGTGTPEIDERIAEVAAIPDAEEQIKAGMTLEAEIMSETWGIFPLYNGPWISAAKKGLANLSPEPYTGLDLFGVSPVENVGWEK